MPPALDKGLVNGFTPELESKTGFLQHIAAALAVLAKKSGCSLHYSPLPELREAVRDWQLAAE
jgi:hypothetical protein